MERYDARLWRNSVMTSFAGSKSWNFCGRRGVKSATALRISFGSNVDIGRFHFDLNRETDGPAKGRDDARMRMIPCLLRHAESHRSDRVCGRG